TRSHERHDCAETSSKREGQSEDRCEVHTVQGILTSVWWNQSLGLYHLVQCCPISVHQIQAETSLNTPQSATEFPQLPVEGYRFTSPTVFNPTSYKHQCHLRSLEVTRDISAAIEAETRQQSKSRLWRQVRQPRLTASRFREVCHVRGESSARSLAVRMLKGTAQTAAMKRGLDREEDILWEYADHCDVSVTHCGIIIRPDAPHLGATPDAKVFDPKEMPPFGLAEIKSCDVDDVSQVKHLTTVKGRACLKKTHKYYYQVQGQLAVSGLEWCDFITDTRTDLTVERIFRDDMMNLVRPKLDQFYHEIYVDVYLNSGE
uniref:YqaJ viral recombinase domain-containing protein n=1 Tax=Oryzias melastigma TaxID=30732 RepID=A0A3B3BSM4_ORYME